MVLVALSFVVGFSTLFTAAGAGVGYAGKEIQLFFAEWSRSVSIVAGLLVIALGVWIGIRSRAPLVCRIAGSRLIGGIDRRGIVGSALLAAGFTLGCMTCFGGAIIATLLIYVGTLGSPLIGAVVMFTFSLGVAVPFFLAAVFLSRVMPVITRLTRYAPTLGTISMTVIVAFGTVLVTDNFHVFSSFLYPFLGLS
jgi:cytochrome c-type biogenesis protein